MSDLSKMYIQQEAAEYLQEAWDIQISPQDLSKMGRFGVGPHFEMVGRSKVFTQKALDEFGENYWRNKRNNNCEAPRPA